jgi:guanosine-3',5'-bis(diphosphate) 3'-pyrophosphohydrolase
MAHPSEIKNIGCDLTNYRYGEVTLLKCNKCNRHWLKYFVEYEAFSKSGRWYRCIIDKETIEKITPENSVDFIESAEWHIKGGSYFDTSGAIGTGGISVDINGRENSLRTQDIYQRALLFAAEKHNAVGQTVPGTNLPYIVHISNVAMEILVADKYSPFIDIEYALRTALLHDVLEDTNTEYNEIVKCFGEDIANGVLALTKDEKLPKEQQLLDSLSRIKRMRKDVACVKIADRITNLQKSTADWPKEKIENYYKESIIIQQELKGTNNFLEFRLETKIREYKTLYINN